MCNRISWRIRLRSCKWPVCSDAKMASARSRSPSSRCILARRRSGTATRPLSCKASMACKFSIRGALANHTGQPRLARRSMRRNQRQQLNPRDHQVHLIKKFTLALGDKFESGGGKAHLLHGSTVSDQAVYGLIFADLP